METQIIKQKVVAAGKRKKAVAKATIVEGDGKVTINNISYEHMPSMFHKLMMKEPIDITKKVLGDFKFNISIKVHGGGTEGRVEASRLALAKSIVKFTKNNDLKKAFLDYDKTLLVADTRRKEPYKPGDSKARSKRQKSYR